MPPLTVDELAGLTSPKMIPLAGRAGLSREVSWVASTEYLAPTDWLRGGEFMMMAGWNFRPSAASMRNYVRRIADFGLSGLGFAVGFRFERVPEPILEEADRLGFAVLEIPFELAFVDIARAAAEILLERDSGSIAAIRREHIEIANGLLRGTLTINDVLMKVASYLGGSVTLFDADGRSTSTGLVLRATRSSPSQLKTIARSLSAQDDRSRLEIVREDDHLTKIEEFFLDEICLALQFDYARRLAIEQTRLQLESDLLHELANGSIDLARTRSKFVAFGLDPERRFGAVAVKYASQPELVRQRIARLLAGLGSQSISARRPAGFDIIVEAKSDDALHHVGELFVSAVPGSTVGVGRVGSIDFVGKSLAQAKYLTGVKRIGLISVRELGAAELLMAIDPRFAASYVEHSIGFVEDNELIDSIEVLLEAGFNWNAASAQLGLHRHTLRFRARKFVDDTGIDLFDPRKRHEVWLALKLRRILGCGTRSERLSPGHAVDKQDSG